MHRHPADYTLFCIGEFDRLKGTIEPELMTHICNGIDVVHTPEGVRLVNPVEVEARKHA